MLILEYQYLSCHLLGGAKPRAWKSLVLIIDFCDNVHGEYVINYSYAMMIHMWATKPSRVIWAACACHLRLLET